MLSPDVLEFLHNLTGQIQLSAAQEGFAETAAMVVRVRAELEGALQDSRTKTGAAAGGG